MPNKVRASCFATLKDLAGFKRAKAAGYSDSRAFEVGDNGIGFTGTLCATTAHPSIALPYEIWMKRWGSKIIAAGKPVQITLNGRTFVATMDDTMPHLEHITNGAGMDVNPGCLVRAGLDPKKDIMLPAEWEWIADMASPPVDPPPAAPAAPSLLAMIKSAWARLGFS